MQSFSTDGYNNNFNRYMPTLITESTESNSNLISMKSWSSIGSDFNTKNDEIIFTLKCQLEAQIKSNLELTNERHNAIHVKIFIFRFT